MIKITDSASEKIKKMLGAQDLMRAGLKVGVVGGGCSGFKYKLSFEEKPLDNDIVMVDNEIQLFVDMKSLLYLDGAEIDYIDGLMGAGFKVNNDGNAKTTCGCGESFSV